MGNDMSVNKTNLSFEDMEYIIQQLDKNQSLKSNLIIIHTLKEYDELIHIKHTTHSSDEVRLINTYLNTNKNINICIYGKNHSDYTVMKKYEQLQEIGFKNIFIYTGGLFEWLTLHQLYGEELYPVDILNSSSYYHNTILDFMLKYKPETHIHKLKLFHHINRKKTYNIKYIDNRDISSDNDESEYPYNSENDY